MVLDTPIDALILAPDYVHWCITYLAYRERASPAVYTSKYTTRKNSSTISIRARRRSLLRLKGHEASVKIYYDITLINSSRIPKLCRQPIIFGDRFSFVHWKTEPLIKCHVTIPIFSVANFNHALDVSCIILFWHYLHGYCRTFPCTIIIELQNNGHHAVEMTGSTSHPHRPKVCAIFSSAL